MTTARFQPLSWRGITALVGTKCGDLTTTAYGLSVAGLVEANPVAAAILRWTGLFGLAVTAVVGTAAVVLVVEWSTNVCRRLDADDRAVTLIYVGGYTPLICLYGAATLHNTMLLLGH